MKNLISIFSFLCCSLVLMAQGDKAVIHPYTLSGGNLSGMSDNGLWATTTGNDSDEGSISSRPRLINVTTGEIIDLPLGEGSAVGNAADVTDDGTMIAGSSQGSAAYYKDGVWTKLPAPAGTRGWGGEVTSMSPDGRYMVGWYYNGGYQVKCAAWKDGELWELSNIPTIDGIGRNQEQQYFLNISSDGKQILGMLSRSFAHDGCCAFVYHTETQTYDMIGWELLQTPEYSPSYVDDVVMSNNGRYVSGAVHLIKKVEGSYFPQECAVPFLYDVETKAFTLYEENADKDVSTSAVSNDGTMFACTPAVNPARSLMIRSGNYWIDLKMVLKQKYGVDFTKQTGFDLTGFAWAISNDGKTLAALSTPQLYCYTIQLPVTWKEAVLGVNLLADYSASPATKSNLTKLEKVNITFERAPSVKTGAQAFIYQGDKKVASSVSITAIAEKTFTLTFPLTSFEAGKTYTIRIPAGSFVMGNADMQNPEINIEYTGRAETPVKMQSSSPADGYSVNELSYNSMLTMLFDTNLATVSGKSGYLYVKGNKEPISTLTLVAGGNRLYAYPLTKRMLMRGNEYLVTIPKGAVTDVTGFCPNDSITLNFIGKYTLSSQFAFFDDFTDTSTSLAQYLLYDGDKLTPTEEMSGWDFDSENTSWNFSIRDDETSDFCAASHSMYTPAGKSDDWMVLPPLQLTNEYFYLSFLAQSYRKASKDSLKIYALATDEDITVMNAETAQRFRSEGRLIYKGQESPGDKEGVLAGEWTRHDVSLAEYKDRRIYLAFVNDNNNQSAVFVDSLSVEYRGNYILGNLTEAIVAQKTSTPVKGYVNVTGKDMTYTRLEAWYELKDGTKSEVLLLDNLELKTDTFYNFTLQDLPLTIGKTVEYKLIVVLGDEEQTISSSVMCIAFEPNRRIVIEEATGDWCQNCPMGIVTLDYLEEHFPDKIIPVSIHYNDVYDFSAYSQYLELSAYPSGKVNRNSDGTLYPMYSGENDMSFVSPEGNRTFTDYVLKDLETLVEADIELHDVAYDKENDEVTMPVRVRFAVDIDEANYNLLTVVVEDSLIGNQYNGFVNRDSEIMGEWCGDGKYASTYVQVYYKDVARAIISTSFNGESNYIPNSVKNNEAIENTIKFTVPNSVRELKNAKVICMLIDGNTGKIINGARCHIDGSDGWSAIDHVTDETEIKVTTDDGRIVINGSTQGVNIYTLQGMPVRNEALQKGIYIFRAILPDGKVAAGKALMN